MKEYSKSYHWDQPWKILTFANFRKYPNEHASHVISVDVISRRITPNGELVTDRLLQLRQPIPTILRKIGIPIPETSYFFERSVLNPITQKFVATSYNLNMRSFFTAVETCTFDADSHGGTISSQTARFSASSFFSRIIEEAAINRFEANAAHGKRGLESVITLISQEIEKELITVAGKVQSNVREGMDELEMRVSQVKKEFGEFECKLDEINTSIDSFTEAYTNGKWYSAIHHNPFC